MAAEEGVLELDGVEREWRADAGGSAGDGPDGELRHLADFFLESQAGEERIDAAAQGILSDDRRWEQEREDERERP
jgi:hypothetical protein